MFDLNPVDEFATVTIHVADEQEVLSIKEKRYYPTDIARVEVSQAGTFFSKDKEENDQKLRELIQAIIKVRGVACWSSDMRFFAINL